MPDDPPPACWEAVSVRYPYQGRDAVGPVTLALGRGERLLLLGPSGAGKSTLLATLAGLVPQTIPATVAGRVRLGGRDVAERQPSEWSDTASWLLQDAAQTLAGMTVADEVAFALENRALPAEEIGVRVAAALAAVGIPQAWRDRRTATLSGGEKQLVALAAALAQDTPVLVADEPTAHLAPEAAQRLRDLVFARSSERGLLVVDHRLDGLIERIDRVAVLGSDGSLLVVDAPRRLFREHGADLARLGIWRPVAADLDARLIDAAVILDNPPLTVDEALAAIQGLMASERRRAAAVVRAWVGACIAPPSETTRGKVVARLVGASCAPLFGPVVLAGVNVEIRSGETVAILGRNGAGKSTLGASLTGLLRLKAGHRQGPPGGMAFQNPECQFVAGTAGEEVADALDRALPREERLRRACDVLAAWGLAGLETRHPFELSQGQKRRLALLTLVAGGRWPLIVLDEPTAGLDAAGVAALAARVGALAREGRAVAVITHDMDFALKTCRRAVVVDEGGIVADRPMIDVARDPALLARAGLAEPAIMPALRWLERHCAC